MKKEFRINNFDLLRLFASIEVFVIHSFPRLKFQPSLFLEIVSNFPGVFMFFTMSGYLISASLEKNQDLRSYFKNRAFRIFPALWACLIVTVIAIWFVTGISFFNKEVLPWILCQSIGIIYTPKFLVGFGFGTYNGSLWTIPLELQFYIILPIIYLAILKAFKSENHKTIILIVIFLAFSFIAYYLKVNFLAKGDDVETLPQKIIHYTFLNNLYLFLFGVILQRLRAYRSRFVFGKGLFWLIAYLFFRYIVPTTDETYIFQLLFLGITTISLAYTLPTLSNKILKGNDISYGFYIYHGLILGIFVELHLFNNIVYIIMIALITCTLAIASWFIIEKPILKRKEKTIHNLEKITHQAFLD